MKDFQKENTLPPGVISIDRLGLCMEAIQARFSGERKENESIRYPFPFEYDEYKLMLVQSANVILERRREKNTFVVDDKNEPVIRQLFLYLRINETLFR